MNTKYSTLGFDKVYVINLKRRQDRKKTLKSIFPTVDFTFIEAIDGKDLDQKQLLKDKTLNTSFFDPNVQLVFKRDLLLRQCQQIIFE